LARRRVHAQLQQHRSCRPSSMRSTAPAQSRRMGPPQPVRSWYEAFIGRHPFRARDARHGVHAPTTRSRHATPAPRVPPLPFQRRLPRHHRLFLPARGSPLLIGMPMERLPLRRTELTAALVPLHAQPNISGPSAAPLGVHGGPLTAPAAASATQGGAWSRDGGGDGRHAVVVAVWQGERRGRRRVGAGAAAEIGRASCRDRVFATV
jgi:hypothetical protein